MSKKCAKCGETFPLNSFYKDIQKIDGYSCYCVSCSKEIRKESYNKFKTEHYWKLSRTLKSSRNRAKAKGIEHTLTLEELKELFPIDNKCPILDIELKWGLPKDTSPSLDRIDNNQGYTYENCQIISNRANKIKSDATIEELELILNYLKEIHFG